MEELALDRPDVFPFETVVGIYQASAVIDAESAPLGGPIESQQVGFVEMVEEENEAEEMVEVPVLDESQTALLFTEIPSKGHYVAGAEVGGVWRYVRVAVGNLLSNLAPPAAFPSHSVG